MPTKRERQGQSTYLPTEGREEEKSAVSGEPDVHGVLLAIQETPRTRKARRNVQWSTLTGFSLDIVAVGVLLLPPAVRCFRERPLWTWQHVALLLFEGWALVILAHWVRGVLWWRSWRGVPYRWEITADGIYRAGRPWVRWQEVHSVQVTQVRSGQRVVGAALKISPRAKQRNLYWGSHYLAFDPEATSEAHLLSVCQQFVPVEPQVDTIRWAPPWLVKLTVAVLVLLVVVTYLVVRWAIESI